VSDPSSWPRDDCHNVPWGDAAADILVARLRSEKPAYEEGARRSHTLGQLQVAA
jgi:hypothetical protein